MPSQARKLSDLVGIGKAMLGDFKVLGVKDVEQLAAEDPLELYERLCERTGQRHDICCLDVFRAAVAQARDPNLPAEQCQWWYWSRQRKRLEKSTPARYK